MIGGLILALSAAGAWSADGPSDGQAVSGRIEIQQARLTEIEEMAVRERTRIEQWYEQRRAEAAQRRAREAAARMDYSYRIRWVEFAKMHRGVPYAEGYFKTPSYVVPAGRGDRPARLRQAMDQEYFIAEMARLLVSGEFREKLAQIATERWDAPFLPVLRDEAKGLLALVTRVQRELAME